MEPCRRTGGAEAQGHAHKIVKDCNCLYSALAQGLAVLRGAATPKHQRVVRADIAAHYRKRPNKYLANWGGTSLEGVACKWDDYYNDIAKNTARGGTTELLAFVRLHDVRIVIIPNKADKPIMAVLSKASERIMLSYDETDTGHYDLIKAQGTLDADLSGSQIDLQKPCSADPWAADPWAAPETPWVALPIPWAALLMPCAALPTPWAASPVDTRNCPMCRR